MGLTEVANLPLREKFQIMEAIRAGLREQVERFEIRQEHRELLDARRARVAAGEPTLHDRNEVRQTTE